MNEPQAEAKPEPTSGEPRRGLRLRWWWWLAIAVVVLLGFNIAMRAHGWSQLKRVQAELAARGMPTNAVELVAAAPMVDHDRQERLWMAMQGKGNWGESLGHAPFSDLQEGRGQGPEQPNIDKGLADGASDVAAIEKILDEGPVLLSVFGWIERDPAKLRDISLVQATSIRIPNLMTVRACAYWWAAKAVSSDDPRPFLRRLDRWNDCLQTPGTLIGAMITTATSRIRDETYLWLATRGRLPAEDLARWAAEKSLHRQWCAAGFAGERCLWWEPGERIGLGEMLSSTGLGASLSGLGWLPMQYHELASCTVFLARMEEQLRNQPLTPAYTPPFNYRGPLSSIAMPNLEGCAITAAEAAQRHRLSRIAAILAVHHRSGDALPADAGALAAWLPAGALDAQDANLPAIAYERLAPTRFRLGLDPHGTLPPDVPAARITSDTGKPAGAKPLGDPQTKWSLEIDLAAILVPQIPVDKPAKPPAAP